MRFPIIYLDEEPILDYLKQFGHGPDSKDYELAISVWIKRLYENANNTNYCLAFEIKGKIEKLKPDFNPDNIEHIKDVLENLRVEDTPLDFILVKGTALSHTRTGWGFQLKRFGRNITQNFFDELVSYLNTLLRTYRPGEVGLIVIPEAGKDLQPIEREELKNVNPKMISRQLDVKDDSFKKVMLLNKGENLVQLTELWPAIKHISMRI